LISAMRYGYTYGDYRDNFFGFSLAASSEDK
jgi:hypothetical protein